MSSQGHEILYARVARAIAWGYRPAATGAPCSGITRYRRLPQGWPGVVCWMKWRAVRPARRALADSKTGPKYGLLGAAARELRDHLFMAASGKGVLPGACIDVPLRKRNARDDFQLEARRGGLAVNFRT